MSETGRTNEVLHNQHERLRGKVLVHAGDNAYGMSLVGHADGIVFHGSAGFKAARSCPEEVLRVVDRESYLADRGKPSMPQLVPDTDADSVAVQVAAGAGCLLAPSRFPADRSPSSIAAMLEAGDSFVAAARKSAPHVPAFVPIVIRFDELADGRWVTPIRESGLPIATIFAGYADPLATPEQLEGAVNVLEAADVAFVLRCDMSVAGLMALSAVAGAIGASSAVRHLWLPSRRAKSAPARSLFVPKAANWMKATFVEQALADPDLDELFRCDCAVCGVRGDLRHLVLPDVSADLQDRHSVAASVDLAHRVLDDHHPIAAWRNVCEQANAGYDRLRALGISGPSKPGALSAWLTILG